MPLDPREISDIARAAIQEQTRQDITNAATVTYTKHTRRRKQITSFDPEQLQLLIDAALTPITLTSTWRKLIEFRQDLYELRSAMRRENHPKFKLVARVKISIPDYPNPGKPPPSGPDTLTTMVLSPSSDKFRELYDQIPNLHTRMQEHYQEPQPQSQPRDLLDPQADPPPKPHSPINDLFGPEMPKNLTGVLPNPKNRT